MQVNNIFENIISKMPNCKVRPSQFEMIQRIDGCFVNTDIETKDGHNICMVEAPTGTGKSMAYLVPGVLNAQKLGKKLIISTATKTLQAQLIERDIPNFIKYSGLKFSYALLKGRSNYLCPYQLDNSLQDDALQTDMFVATSNTIQSQLKELNKLFTAGVWDGDLDTMPHKFNDKKIIKLITTDKDRCLGSSCGYNQKENCSCPYFKNRASLKFCDVIVTNHSLLLADISLGGGVLLPVSPENYLLCLDEGHNFADLAINSFTQTFELKQAITSCNHLAKLIYNESLKTYIYAVDVSLCDAAVTDANELAACLDKLLLLLNHNTHLFVEERLMLNDYITSGVEVFKEHFVTCAYIAGELYTKLTKIKEKLKEKIKSGNDYIIETNLNKLGFYISTIENILATSQYMINQDESRYNANARWVEIKSVVGLQKSSSKFGASKANTDIEFVFYACLTHVGNLLFNRLWSRVYAAAIVSATLSVGKDFRYYLHKLGLNLYSNVAVSKLNSSFIYAKQAQIVVPRFNSSPDYASRNEFTRELTNYLIKTLDYDDAYGTLVLFFNRSQLQESYGLLPDYLKTRVLLQTDYLSNQKLINEHKKKIDNKKPSIIFGLNSFGLGVNLPSLYCVHVIITKLPFETHKDPLNMVQEYWLKFEKSNYFIEVSLPETCIKLVQAAGRLIRDENDYGQLTICDMRLITKNYGALLLDSLPAFNRKYDKDFISKAYESLQAVKLHYS